MYLYFVNLFLVIRIVFDVRLESVDRPGVLSSHVSRSGSGYKEGEKIACSSCEDMVRDHSAYNKSVH